MSSTNRPFRPWWKRAGYFYIRLVCQVLAVAFFGYRMAGVNRFPLRTGALVCSNHQSNFDPVLVGMAVPERMNYVARKTLFKFKPFGWLIDYLDAIPLERDGMGIGGIKETLRRLGRNESVLIFPEGTRTTDGRVGRLRPGFYAIARRSGRPIVPVAIDGAFDAWPKGQPLPRPGRMAVSFGEAITPEQIKNFDEPQLLEELEKRIRACFEEARHLCGK